LSERGTYGNRSSRRHAPWGQASVGLKLYHTLGDSDRATAQIDTEMNAIVDAVYRAMGVDPSIIRLRPTLAEIAKMPKEDVNAWKDHVFAAKAKAAQSPFWGFWDAAVSPIYAEWMQFRGDQKYYNLFTSWEEYEKWLDRAKQLREAIKSRGIRIETPDPMDLTKTLPGALLDKTGEAVMEFGKIAKWAVIGLLGIGGVVAITYAARGAKAAA
jgi:hypothetical protein